MQTLLPSELNVVEDERTVSLKKLRVLNTLSGGKLVMGEVHQLLEERTMSTREKLIQARISMLALADELQNISRACKVAGISRTHFYEIKEAFERYGREGLAPQPRRRPRMPNQTPPELEAQILGTTREYPTTSYVKIADQLKLIGVPATANQVRGVWLRHGLVKAYDRLLWVCLVCGHRRPQLKRDSLDRHDQKTILWGCPR